MPWFTTKGQFFQLLVQVLALCIAAHNAWPDMRSSDYFSGGALLFYALVALVFGTLVHLSMAVTKGRTTGYGQTEQRIKELTAQLAEKTSAADIRDGMVSQLEKQIATDKQRSMLFHPDIAGVGRRLEYAVYGSARKPPRLVTSQIEALVNSGERDISVNHYKLCLGVDPDEGEDNFLTVVISETVRQSGRLVFPIEWPTASTAASQVGPKLIVDLSAPQRGLKLCGDEQWNQFSASIQNSDNSKSACDLTVRVEFADVSKRTNDRVIERALFVMQTRSLEIKNFSNMLRCLEAKHEIEVVLAAWGNSGPVQAVSSWPVEPPAALSPGGLKHPIGAELYPGVWMCKITATCQNFETSESFRLEVKQNGVQWVMPPPAGYEKKA